MALVRVIKFSEPGVLESEFVDHDAHALDSPLAAAHPSPTGLRHAAQGSQNPGYRVIPHLHLNEPQRGSVQGRTIHGLHHVLELSRHGRNPVGVGCRNRVWFIAFPRVVPTLGYHPQARWA